MRILLTTAMLLLLPVQLSFADATITTTFTSAQVATVAGSDSDIGNQLPPENGVIKNSVFSEVVQDPNTGNGAGQATAKVEVSQVEPKKLFAIMQSTSSTLPPGEASSISSLSFFFNESGRVFIDVQIRQGNVSYLIDGVKRGFNETEIELPKGQHKVEFRSQTAFPVNNVFNPNVGAFVDIIEDSPSIAPTAVPTNAPSNPNNNSNSSFTTQVNSLITSINAVKTPKNKAQKAIQIALLKQIKDADKLLRDGLTTNASTLTIKGNTKLPDLIKKVKAGVAGLKGKSGDALSDAKKVAKKALKNLATALS